MGHGPLVPPREVTYVHIDLDHTTLSWQTACQRSRNFDNGSRTAFADGGGAVQLLPARRRRTVGRLGSPGRTGQARFASAPAIVPSPTGGQPPSHHGDRSPANCYGSDLCTTFQDASVSKWCGRRAVIDVKRDEDGTALLAWPARWLHTAGKTSTRCQP